MSIEDVISKINFFLVDEFEVDESKLNPDDNLRDALDFDSLDYVDLVVVIESEFGVKLTADVFKEINTLSDFYQFIFSEIK